MGIGERAIGSSKCRAFAARRTLAMKSQNGRFALLAVTQKCH
jgi:hypothetical protein